MDREMNGPTSVEVPSNGPRLWEKPWTIDEMRKNANNWSLAGDAGLLQHLQEFSHQMISRVHEIGKEVDGLLHDTKMTGVRVHNVFNDFIMLANTQFVENRVYDEDVSQEEKTKEANKEETQEKTREQREAELIPKVSEALQLGIKVTEDAFETLDSNVVNSDSEDDDDTNYRVDPILEAKDPYLTRPLPFLIGTPVFMSDDAVGLREESEEEEVGHGELSESEDDNESVKSLSSESLSETEKPAAKPRARTQTSESESSDGSDLFGVDKKSGSDESDGTEKSDVDDEKDEDEAEETKDAKIGGFASELASKLGIAPPPVEESKEKPAESISSHKTKKSKKERDKEKTKEKKNMEDADLFPSSVQEDDEDPFFAGKGGLFSTSKGLFDDEEEDDGGSLFADEVKKEEAPKKTRAESKIKNPPPTAADSGGGGLFDDDDSFFSAGTKKDKAKPATAAPSTKSDLFEDEDEDLFESKENKKIEPEKKKNEKKLPAGAVSMFGSGPNPMTAAIKKQRQDSDEEENDYSDGDKSRSSSIKSNTSSSALPKPVDKLKKDGKSSSKNSLFDDDENENALFSAPPKPRADSKTKTVPTSSLFEADDDDLFSTTKNTGSTPASQKKTVETKPRAASLFDEDEGDDLFGVPASKPKDEKKKPVGGVSLFGGVDVLKKPAEKDIKEPEKKPEPVKAPPAKTTLSLFDDDEEEEDLFGTKPSTAKEPQIKTDSTRKTKDLFADDDLLFGEEEQSPGVDIFGSPPKALERREPEVITTVEPAEEPKKENMATSPPKKKPVGGVSMFGGMDPMAALKNRKRTESSQDAEIKPKADVDNKTEQKESPSPSKAASLFGQDEDDDIFGTVKTGTKKTEIKSPVHTGADEDGDIFSTSNPTVNKTKEPVSDEKKDDIFSTSKPTVNKTKEPVNDERMDDIFSTSKPTVNKTKEPVIDEKKDDLFSTNVPDIVTTKKADILFNEDEGEDLFSTKPPPIPEEPVKPKKPVGGVSMFGGMDPATALKKKQEKLPPKDSLFGDDNEDDLFAPKDEAASSKPDTKPVQNMSSAAPVKKPAGGVSMFGGMDPFGANKEKLEPQTTKEPDHDNPVSSSSDKNTKETLPSSPTKAAGKIGKLQMNLGINPAALLPGAAPPSEKPENEAVGFDKPAEAKTLQSANKDRAKIQTKRRPPSRLSRHFSPEPSIEDMSPSPPAVLDNDRVPQPTSDLFGNEDMFRTSPEPAESRTITPRDDGLKGDNNSAITDKSDVSITSNDIFSASSETKKTTDDDIFSSKPSVPKSINFDDELFSAKTPIAKPAEKTPAATPAEKITVKKDDAEDDIFAPKKTTKIKSKTIFDDEEDIFASSSIKDKPPSKPAEAKQTEKETANKTEQKEKKEDIFEDSSLKPKDDIPKSSEKEVTKSTKEGKPPAEENDDDIFSSKVTKKKVKKTMTKDEDLFKDDTDIFADVPVAKTKEKKKKKTTGASKSIFKEDVDDIFADASGAPKPKKEKTKKSAATTDVKDDIFDDPLA